MISYTDFDRVYIHVGRIVIAEDFPQARRPAYKLIIDFGPEIGIKLSSAQIVKHYTKEDLQGTLILAVTNLPAKQIGPLMSEVLTLGVADEAGDIVLIRPAADVSLGSRMF